MFQTGLELVLIVPSTNTLCICSSPHYQMRLKGYLSISEEEPKAVLVSLKYDEKGVLTKCWYVSSCSKSVRLNFLCKFSLTSLEEQ